MAAAVTAAASWAVCGAAAAFDIQATEQIFNFKCIGCHSGGGNVLAVGQSLFPDDLKRNGMLEPQALFDIIYKGKGKMPGFGQDCAPKGQCTFGPRLADQQVQDLADFVLAKAETGWR